MLKKNMDWKIWTKKVFMYLALAVISGILVEYGDIAAGWGLIPVFEGIRGILKHKLGYKII